MFDASPAAHHPTEEPTRCEGIQGTIAHREIEHSLYFHVVAASASGRSNSNLDFGRVSASTCRDSEQRSERHTLLYPVDTLPSEILEMQCRLNGSHKWCITTYKTMNGPKMLPPKNTHAHCPFVKLLPINLMEIIRGPTSLT